VVWLPFLLIRKNENYCGLDVDIVCSVMTESLFPDLEVCQVLISLFTWEDSNKFKDIKVLICPLVVKGQTPRITLERFEKGISRK